MYRAPPPKKEKPTKITSVLSQTFHQTQGIKHKAENIDINPALEKRARLDNPASQHPTGRK